MVSVTNEKLELQLVYFQCCYIIWKMVLTYDKWKSDYLTATNVYGRFIPYRKTHLKARCQKKYTSLWGPGKVAPHVEVPVLEYK